MRHLLLLLVVFGTLCGSSCQLHLYRGNFDGIVLEGEGWVAHGWACIQQLQKSVGVAFKYSDHPEYGEIIVEGVADIVSVEDLPDCQTGHFRAHRFRVPLPADFDLDRRIYLFIRNPALPASELVLLSPERSNNGQLCDGCIDERVLRAIAAPECITDLNDRIYSQGFPDTREPLPQDQWLMIVRYMGNPDSPDNPAEFFEAIDYPVTWDASGYTGFTPPEPISDWQRGFYNLGPPIGTNAFQLHCDSAGSLINTFSFDHSYEIVGGGPHMVYTICFSEPERPFLTPSSELVMEAHIAIPWIYRTHAELYGQVSISFSMKDTVSGTRIAYVVFVGGTNDFIEEYLDHDTFVPFVSTHFGETTQYVTLGEGSATTAWSGETFHEPRFYQFSIDRPQFAQALRDMAKANPDTGMSKNPADYILRSACVLHEVLVGSREDCNVSMGVGIHGFGIYEAY